ncbi:diguanylate cyclase [Geomobilimonas luticola]|uniref:diguanylate cyclase n=1 Tax=Geomobilimonas luticola TaxID=1114878 RepID=A0ABS5SAD6_9BACT|nr:diguanylate cyclase [Geomobilimonas luticola]MBT0652331.1 diguanylate cyclase [Geomobilimonas luticola]
MPENDIKDMSRRFINFITFIDLPIKKKFRLFSVGVLFWFVMLFVVTMAALLTVDRKTDNIVRNLIPQDRLAQKIARNIQSLNLDALELARTSDLKNALRRIETSKARIEDINAFLSALEAGGKVNDYSRESGKLLETFTTSSVKGDLAGEKYLREMAAVQGVLVKKLQAFVDLKMGNLHDNIQDNGRLDAKLREYQQSLTEALTLSNDYSTSTSLLYAQNAEKINSTVTYTSSTIAVVLVIALLLLGVFTIWISRSIANPVNSIIEQIHALGTGDVDLSKKIAIHSKDEIGILSTEFNGLMESIHGMTTFKKVIEEDDTLEDVYSRLGRVLREQVGIDEFLIYEISLNQNKMNPVYPLLLSDSESFCSPDILDSSELCKAKKTGHAISSLVYPHICKQFQIVEGKEHYCIPMIVGGGTGGVVQLVFDKSDPRYRDQHAIDRKVFKARQYVKESLSVIEAKRLMNTLRDSALKDSLTGLYNRRFLQECTENMVAGVMRRGKNIGLIMCDLDYFKQVNDVYGHNAGDAVLKETSALIRSSVRSSDLVIRFGGEEFLVVLLDTNKDETMKVAEKIRENIQNAKFKVQDGVLKKTISLGVSEFPIDTQLFWQAIKYADVALYKAKETGRNKAIRFTEEMWTGEQF